LGARTRCLLVMAGRVPTGCAHHANAAARTATRSADAIIAHIRQPGLRLEWLIETHVHAGHLSAAPYIQAKLGGKIGIGERIAVVQDTFGKVFNEDTEFPRDGSQFDRLFKDGDSYTIGGLTGSPYIRLGTRLLV
jgi:glyoxylase-like metal-dependent hydrolase (beta-lactamase superfamily II)